ncbi:hypothetical protein EZJ55_00710 [Microcystis aeruginosa EAWAG127a]|uniref:Uncharacterized protein n=1 Tax=Microcystis aeruginosa EAWAG127a TaxID=2529855 RepID=A0A5J5LP90_MICAE|nr:hypothetical protein [Microcystis aeruginosa]KAB0238244.1 hypothetical protein EZJ55_24565 [Microcystis aeruginosa EAWAG127a]KAB0238270.1 hypothetical protein EZJ55_24715 [Microcystis aeruginosa EAWAG127a]KAB0243740.1 hypothetical protein EZJ55_00710 [Microcystis aeruginosa EAWAG127a]
MSKVISFSISDRYLDKLRSLYPELTDNLAAKQFLTDQLDADLDDNLDTNLDDKLKILIEKSLGDRLDAKLDDRLDATEKSISKWILDFDNRIKDIDREMKDRSIAVDDQIEKIKNRLDNWTLATSSDIKDVKDKSIAIDDQIKAIEARLDESLDKNLDGSLDESLDSSLYESYSEIFIDKPDENLDDSLDTNLDTNLDNSLDKEPVTLEEILLQKKMIREEWLTLKEILGQRRKDWPKSIEGLRKKAIREGWPRRDHENRKEYQIPVGK